MSSFADKVYVLADLLTVRGSLKAADMGKVMSESSEVALPYAQLLCVLSCRPRAMSVLLSTILFSLGLHATTDEGFSQVFEGRLPVPSGRHYGEAESGASCPNLSLVRGARILSTSPLPRSYPALAAR